MKYLHARCRAGKAFNYGTIAKFNRWSHQPHKHKREIARNQRRAAA